MISKPKKNSKQVQKKTTQTKVKRNTASHKTVDENELVVKKIKRKEQEKKNEEKRKLKLQEERSKMYGKSKDTSRHYATNRGLMEELIKWRDSATDPKERRPSEEFGKMIMDIAERLTNHSCFRNYPYHIKEEMRSYAHEKFMTGVQNYNFKFKNPFAYFTQMCFNSFKTVLSKHYKQVNIKRALTKKAIASLEQYVPNSSIGKCLNNQFLDNEYGEMD